MMMISSRYAIYTVVAFLLFTTAYGADEVEEEEEKYDCFWGDDQEHTRGGYWNVTLKCQKGDFNIKLATSGDPLTINMKWRDGSKEFKFCALPSNSFHQPWTVIAGKADDHPRYIEINQAMKYYTYESPEQLDKRFKDKNCAISGNKQLEVTIKIDDNYMSHRFTYVIYPQ